MGITLGLKYILPSYGDPLGRLRHIRVAPRRQRIEVNGVFDRSDSQGPGPGV